jgi:hypothetical protein
MKHNKSTTEHIIKLIHTNKYNLKFWDFLFEILLP